MFKKLLVIICVLALALGVFSMTAAAQTSQDENAFKAGYAKVDINPWWSIWAEAGETIPSDYTADQIMPLPMDGYGDGAGRLSEPTLKDDNGDDTVDADDGLHATCIAMQKGSNTLLLISVDILRIDDGWGKLAREAVAAATGVPYENIMLSASHTHGGIDMDCGITASTTYTVKTSGKTHTGAEISAYRDAYTTHLYEQLVEAAENAMQTAVPVTARRGTIDAGTQTGHTMNSVRHYVQTYTEKNWRGTTVATTTYVRGSNFNNDMNGDGSVDSYYNYSTKANYNGTSLTYTWSTAEADKSKPVSTADDSLHLLELVPTTGEDSIILVNWRAHATAGTPQANRYLSSDYVGSLRKQMESAGYRPAFFLGAAGNLVPHNGSESTTPWYQQGTSTYAQRSVNYGTALANAAVAMLKGENIVEGAVVSPMAQVATGEIQTKKLDYTFTGRGIAANEHTAAENHKAGTGCSRTDGKYPCAHTVNGETYVFASAAHANASDTIYGYNNGKTWSKKADVNVLTVGDALAFVTAPFEISDRYSADPDLTLSNADQYNDWDGLNTLGFSTPFVLSCTNEYWSYVPNHLAYNYGVDEIAPYNHESTFALGSYESQISYAVDGTGEALVALYKNELTEMAGFTADCECCDTQDVQWLPLTREHLTSGELSGGHYYLREDMTYEGVVNISGTVCLDLHGQTYTAYNPTGLARFVIASGGVLNITDSLEQGAIVGTGVHSSAAADLAGGTVWVQSGGELNLYNGTLTFQQKDTHTVLNGGVMTVQGVFNMYDGAVQGGVANQFGGNIFVSGGTMYMYGGTVANGTVTGQGVEEGVGGNILTNAAATLELRGGQITGGSAAAEGQSVYSMGNLTLAGNHAAQIQFNAVPAETLKIDGTYTGSVVLKMPGDREAGEVIGTGINDPDISGAQITLNDNSYIFLRLNDNNQLVVAEVAYMASIADQRFTTVQAAVDAWLEMDDPQPIKLSQDAAGIALTLNLTADVELDLNGIQPGALTVNGAGRVLCMDSLTDDYSVENETYGKVPANDRIQAADGYMMINEDGMVSFHKVQNKINSINLRPSNVGLYYGSQFAGDEVVKENVLEYGIALRIGSAPTASYITGDEENKFHVAFAKEAWATGTDANGGYGVLLHGIMTPGDSLNAMYATANVYGATYIKTADGMHLSEAKRFTLKEVVEAVDGMYNGLSATQKYQIKVMYRAYESVMSSWNIENIKTAAGQ